MALFILKLECLSLSHTHTQTRCILSDNMHSKLRWTKYESTSPDLFIFGLIYLQVRMLEFLSFEHVLISFNFLGYLMCHFMSSESVKSLVFPPFSPPSLLLLLVDVHSTLHIVFYIASTYIMPLSFTCTLLLLNQ